jgi:hypothetical protein
MEKQQPDDGGQQDIALELYLNLCMRMYERMEKEGFPWETNRDDTDAE